jgi:transposase
MRFYNGQRQFYCGTDLHGKTMYVCILDRDGKVRAHRNLRCGPELFLKFIEPFRPNLVVGVECMFAWYWLADLCADEGIDFVLGHAQYMKMIHGGKAKNDRIDAHKLAVMLRGGMFPMAYVYPAKMRSTRDLLRRRNHLMRKRSELASHIANTNTQYGLPSHGRVLDYARKQVIPLDKYKDPAVKMSMAVDQELIKFYNHLLPHLEQHILKLAGLHDPRGLALLRTVPGIGKILGLTMLYEIHDISRFPRVQDFASYTRLVAPPKKSAGKLKGFGRRKVGNVHLKWAFSEAAVLFMTKEPLARAFVERKARKHGKGKAISILAHKLGRAVYFMLKRKEAFDIERFFLNK